MTEPFASLPAITPDSLAFYQSACGIPDSDLWFEAVQDLAEDAANHLMDLAQLPEELKSQLRDHGIYVPDSD